VFYWFGAYYSSSLLVQACLMIVVQVILLKVALDNRPPIGAKHGLEHLPFSDHSADGTLQALLSGRRPYDFWKWANPRP
jgi:solute carrier family 66, member 2